MASKSTQTIIVRVPSAVKRMARARAKERESTITDYIIELIEEDFSLIECNITLGKERGDNGK